MNKRQFLQSGALALSVLPLGLLPLISCAAVSNQPAAANSNAILPKMLNPPQR